MNIENRPEKTQKINQGIQYISQFFEEVIFEGKCDKVQAVLPQEERKLLKATVLCDLYVFTLHYFGRYLSKEARDYLTETAVGHVSLMLRYDKCVKDIRDAMGAEGIEFIAFKGVDTAYRCYPVPGLRRMTDIDLLFHKEDLPRALKILEKLGWKQTIDKDNGYHWEEMVMDNLIIEPHYKIPLFSDDVQDELWQYTVMDSRGIRVFTPEVAFLILYLHLERSKWAVYNRARFMLDTAYHIKYLPPDWNLLAELERKWNLPDVRVLPKTFSEVIPDGLVPNDPPIDPELLSTFSYLVNNNYLFPVDRTKVLLDRDPFSKKWWKETTRIFQPIRMRYKYNLPKKGAYCRLAWCYVVDLSSKARRILSYYIRKMFAKETPEAVYLRKMREYQELVSRGKNR